MDIDFWVAVAALLVAVWAVVRCGSSSKASAKRDAYVLDRVVALKEHTHERMIEIENAVEEIDPSRTRHALEWHALDARIRALEESIKDLEAISRYLGDAVGEDILPDVIRTTSGDRPEIKNVEAKP